MIGPLILILSVILWSPHTIGHSEEASRPWCTYSDPEYGFEFKYPDYPKLQLKVTDAQDSHDNQRRQIFLECLTPILIVTIYANPRNLNPEEFANLRLQKYRIKKEDTCKNRIDVDGHSSIEITFPGAGSWDRVSEVYLSHGDYLLVITMPGTSEYNAGVLNSISFSNRIE